MEALWGEQSYQAGFKFETVRHLLVQCLNPVFLQLRAAFPFLELSHQGGLRNPQVLDSFLPGRDCTSSWGTQSCGHVVNLSIQKRTQFSSVGSGVLQGSWEGCAHPCVQCEAVTEARTWFRKQGTPPTG